MFRYSVRYRRSDVSGRTFRLTVTARNADEARRKAAIRDPKFSHTVESPKRGAAVVPEQADGMTAAKARDDLLDGVSHFDREYVTWRGTKVEVVD